MPQPTVVLVSSVAIALPPQSVFSAASSVRPFRVVAAGEVDVGDMRGGTIGFVIIVFYAASCCSGLHTPAPLLSAALLELASLDVLAQAIVIVAKQPRTASALRQLIVFVLEKTGCPARSRA